MIDTHCHCLWGVDDASKEESESLKMIEVAIQDGIEAIMCTPHSLPTYIYENDAKTLETPWYNLNQAVQRKGWKIELALGCEFFLTDQSIDWIAQGRAVTLNQTKRLLIELPWYQGVTLKTSETKLIQQVRELGYDIIIAHPERYRCVQENMDVIQQWRQLGCDFQINRTSLLNLDETNQCRTAWKLVENGYCDAIGTDAHNYVGRRIIQLSDIYRVLNERFGHDVAHLLCHENGRNLLQGAPLIHTGSLV